MVFMHFMKTINSLFPRLISLTGLSKNMSVTPECRLRESISVCFLDARQKQLGMTTLDGCCFWTAPNHLDFAGNQSPASVGIECMILQDRERESYAFGKAISNAKHNGIPHRS